MTERPRAFLSVSRNLPIDLMWRLHRVAETAGLEPHAYYGLEGPKGDISNSTFVEARGDLRAAQYICIVRATAADTFVDWLETVLPELTSAGWRAWRYTVSERGGAENAAVEGWQPVPLSEVVAHFEAELLQALGRTIS